MLKATAIQEVKFMKFLSQVTILLICVFLMSACITQRVFEDEIHKRDVQIASLESEVEMN